MVDPFHIVKLEAAEEVYALMGPDGAVWHTSWMRAGLERFKAELTRAFELGVTQQVSVVSEHYRSRDAHWLNQVARLGLGITEHFPGAIAAGAQRKMNAVDVALALLESLKKAPSADYADCAEEE